jgi:MT0933-like antitoxin protein
MSVLENMKSKVKEFTEPDGPGAEMLSSAKTTLVHGLDGASRFVDEKTNRKYSDTIHSGVGKAKEFLGEKKPESGPAEASPGTPPEASAGSASGASSAGSAEPKGSVPPDGAQPGPDGSAPSGHQPPQS